MSKIYQNSINSHSKYYESQSRFCEGFHRYYFESGNIKQERKKSSYGFEYRGKGGVPLEWQKDKKCISIDQTDSHTLVIGATGAKKSRLIAMPTVHVLGAAGETMIIVDPKAEIFYRTSGRLKEMGYQVTVVNFREPEYSDCWNPLSIPYQFYCNGEIDRAYEFINDMAENLMRSGQQNASEPFWENSAGSLFFGLTMLLFKYCKEHGLPEDSVNLSNVILLREKMLSGTDSKIKNSIYWRYAKEDPYLVSALIGTVETADATRAGILSTFDENMRGFTIQPNLLNMLCNNTVLLDSITEKPTAIYLIIPDEKTSYHKLVSLFVKQSYEYLIFLAHQRDKMENSKCGGVRIRVNYVLDEFSALPTIKDFPAMITAARSRDIRFVLIVQSKHQLLRRYGEETETIQSNCGNWIFLASRELSFLKEISELCGERTNRMPLLTVSDLQRLDKADGEALILCGRLRPYIAHLADIDIYEKKRREPFQVAGMEKKEIMVLDLSCFIEQEKEEIAQKNQRLRIIDEKLQKISERN